jgi:uroporphyrinogen-III decarboxylase
MMGSLHFSFLHRGSDEFMSVKQFEKFYWPGLEKVLLAEIEAGMRPMVFWEGTWNNRLEFLKTLPKGKVVGWFDRTDLFKAKKVLGDNMCICGDMPLSLLQTGTPEQVKAYAKRLIDEVGEGGGFIMGTNTVMDYADPKLVKVWVDFTKEYGVYKK